MRLPGRAHLKDPYGGIVSTEIQHDHSRAGHIDTGSNAYPERVAEARRAWPEGRSEDFEPVDRRGNFWKDLATGTLYRRLPGAPVLDIGQESTRGVSCFLVRNGEIIVLRPASYEPALYGPVGYVHGAQVVPTPTTADDVRIL